MTASQIFALVIVLTIHITGVMSHPDISRHPRQLMMTTSTTAAPSSGVVYQIPNCDCQTTSEYNPVCGSDGVTYQNRQKLECAVSCGSNVRVRRFGACGSGLKTVMERRRS